MSKQTQETTSTADTPVDTNSAPGERLRLAREQAGLSIADVASRLRLRSSVIEAMERDDLESLGAPVFARGYVDGYVRLLELPPELVEEFLPRDQIMSAVPPLHSNNQASRNRQLMDRFARRLVYVALTASIVVPVVLLSTSDHLTAPAELLSPLQVPSAAAPDSQNEGQPAVDLPNEEAGPPAPAGQAVVASFTPFYSSTRTPAPSTASVAEAVPAVASGLELEINGESWVEVIGKDGARLAHDLLRSGDQPVFDPHKVSHVLLGNAAAVTVRLNGEKLDTTPFRRANVARFAVSSDGLLSPSDD